MVENKYYVYLHIKGDNGEPFYVGKGKNSRCTRTTSRSIFWNNIVDKHGFDIIFLEENLSNIEANDREIYWIDRIGRRDLGLGPLVNHTCGGDGVCIWSDDMKKRISESHTGRKHTEKSKFNMSVGQKKRFENSAGTRKGSKTSEETKRKISESKKGRKSKNGFIVMDVENGIFYNLPELSEILNIKRATLYAKLKGHNKNNTNFIIV